VVLDPRALGATPPIYAFTAATLRGGLTRFRYFPAPSSRSCAIDCRGTAIVELHSVQTPTRTLENVTRDLVGLMLRISNRVCTGFRHELQMPDVMSPSWNGAVIVASRNLSEQFFSLLLIRHYVIRNRLLQTEQNG
jgi:hypothetical protein